MLPSSASRKRHQAVMPAHCPPERRPRGGTGGARGTLGPRRSPRHYDRLIQVAYSILHVFVPVVLAHDAKRCGCHTCCSCHANLVCFRCTFMAWSAERVVAKDLIADFVLGHISISLTIICSLDSLTIICSLISLVSLTIISSLISLTIISSQTISLVSQTIICSLPACHLPSHYAGKLSQLLPSHSGPHASLSCRPSLRSKKRCCPTVARSLRPAFLKTRRIPSGNRLKMLGCLSATSQRHTTSR